MAASPTIWTIGYERASSDALLAALKAAGVQVLMDVRDLPLSRRAGFSKSTLRASLEAVGIEYVHLKGLGTPKEGRLAARSGDVKALKRIYAKHLKTDIAKQEMSELSMLIAKAGPVCILCYERDHSECHRKFIAEIIEEKDGVAVENLVAPQM